MEPNTTKEQHYLKVEKKVKDIKGFYAHLIATLFIVPFFILINLELAPQYRWYSFAIVAWVIGLFIHWLNVFKLSKLNFKKEWEEKKIKEMIGEDTIAFSDLEASYIEEQYYIRAKKRVKEVKGFYIHLGVTLVSLAIIVAVNLTFVPSFHFFWYAGAGMLLGVFLHWMGVYGLSYLGFGKEWEDRRIKELLISTKRK
jgi:uncharacterized membrane protein